MLRPLRDKRDKGENVSANHSKFPYSPFPIPQNVHADLGDFRADSNSIGNFRNLELRRNTNP